MSIFFELPMNLRQQWWNANTWQEREAVEEEFHKMKEEAVEKVNVADLYQEALEVIQIPAWHALETKLSSPGSTQVVVRLQAYLAALRAEREAWKVFAKGGPHSELDKAHKRAHKALAELNALVID